MFATALQFVNVILTIFVEFLNMEVPHKPEGCMGIQMLWESP